MTEYAAATGTGTVGFVDAYRPDSVTEAFRSMVDQTGVIELAPVIDGKLAALNAAARSTKLASQKPSADLPEEMEAALAETDLDSVRADLDSLQPFIDLAGGSDGACWTLVKARWYQYGSRVSPRGPAIHHHRVIRGGSFATSEEKLRSQFRDNDLPTVNKLDIGFRVARPWIPLK